MNKMVERTYRLTPEEAKTAIWLFLANAKHIIPQDKNDLKLSWNVPGEVVVTFTERESD
jgi:hypothetical protein